VRGQLGQFIPQHDVVHVTMKIFDFGSAIIFGYIKVHIGLLFDYIKKIATVRVKKKFSTKKKSTVKSCQFGRKVFFLPYCGNLFFINKKAAQCALLYTQITAPKSKIKKMKIEDFFGRKLFLPHHCSCGNFLC
jgi:hypothetical protein